MEIDANVYNLINLLLQVVLWYLIITAPMVLLTIELYLYGRYKKWKDSEIQEKEKIIVGKANTIQKFDADIQYQHEEKHRLNLDIELLMKRKKALQEELGISEESNHKVTEEINLDKMNVKQLKAVAKDRGLKMYSKKNKKQLLKMLQE